MRLSKEPKPSNTVRAVSFQNKEYVDVLINTGIYEASGWARREDKTEFYSKYLKSDREYCYSFASLTSCNDCVGSPISLATISLLWSSLMGYYRLDGRSIIEMDIPIKEGVLGAVNELKVFDSLWDYDESTEVVTSYLKKEWVREVYHPTKYVNTYAKVPYKSTIDKDPYAMFKGECSFSGDSSYCDEFIWKTPNVGLTLVQNLQRMSTAKGRQLLVSLAKQELGFSVEKWDAQECREIALILGDYIVEEI